MAEPTHFVFLDTSVFVAEHLDYRSERFRILGALIRMGRVRLVLPDVALREIKTHLRAKVALICSEHATFVKTARLLSAVDAGLAATVLHRIDMEALLRACFDDFDRFLADTHALQPSCGDLQAQTVLDDYFECRPPFASSDKKNEFPDAFILLALRKWSTDNGGVEVVVVSGDRGMKAACETGLAAFRHLPSLGHFLAELADNPAARAQFVQHEVSARLADVSALYMPVFQQLGFKIRDEDGFMTNVSVHDVASRPEDVLVVETDDTRATVMLPVTVSFSGLLAYPAKVWTPTVDGDRIDTRWRSEAVEQTEDRLLDISVTFRKLDPSTFTIDNVADAHPSSVVEVAARTRKHRLRLSLHERRH